MILTLLTCFIIDSGGSSILTFDISPLSQTETDFLRLSIEPQDFPKIIFVVNMLDLAQTDADAKRILSHVSARINGLFPNAQIYGLSAFDEFCRITNEPRPNIALAPLFEKNFAEFRANLQNSIALDRSLIQLDRAGDLLRLKLDDFSHSIQLLAAALNKQQDELEASVAKLADSDEETAKRVAAEKQKFLDAIRLLGEQCVRWLDEFFERLKQETLPRLTDFGFDEVRRNFHFFLSDSLREAAAQHEPRYLLFLSFLWGGTALIFAALIINTIVQETLGQLASTIISAPLTEEICKAVVIFAIFFVKSDEFNDVVDGVIYAAMTALGFAMVENFAYYGRAFAGLLPVGTVAVFVARGVQNPFLHPFLTAMTGIGLGLAAQTRNKFARVAAPLAGLALAVFFHALWNFSALSGVLNLLIFC